MTRFINLQIDEPLSFFFMYLISIVFIGFVGVGIIEWFNRRFAKFIMPMCDRIASRRKKVIEREEKKRQP